MSLGETVIDNAREIAQVSGNSSGAHIDETERQALAESTVVESEAARAIGGAADHESEGSLIAGAVAEQFIPGLKVLSTIGTYASDRGLDMAAQGLSKADRGNARTIEETIHDTKRAPGSYTASGDIVSRANNTAKSLLNKTDTDSFTTDFFGGGKKNAMHIPADQSTAQGLNKSMEAIFGKRLSNKKTLDSVHAARLERSAAIGKAMQMAPGMDMGSGPRFNANEILAEAERYRDTVAGTITG